MTAQELRYDFLLKKDRVQSLSTSNFNDAEIDWFINEAQRVYLNKRLKDYETNQDSISALSNLHIKYPIQPYVALIDHQSVYELPLSSLSYPYNYYLRGTVFVDNGKCVKEVMLKFVQSDDISEILLDPFNNASVEEFIPYNFGRSSNSSGSSIYIYPSNLKLLKANIEYIKYPSRVSQGTYTYIDGVVYPEATLEFDSSVHPEIIDLAVEIATLAVQDPSIEYAKLKTLLND